MRPKPRLPWPQPGDPDRLVSKQTICQQMDISEAHFDRLADAPDAILDGERIRRWWAQSWNQWLLRRTRPAPYFVPEPRRQPKHARPSAADGEATTTPAALLIATKGAEAFVQPILTKDAQESPPPAPAKPPRPLRRKPPQKGAKAPAARSRWALSAGLDEMKR